MADVWRRQLSKALYGPLGDIVMGLEPDTEADPLAVYVQLICTFGNYIGNKPHFLINGQKIRLNDFVVIVGDSARSRKGTSWGICELVFDAVDLEYINHRVVNGLATGEGLIAYMETEVEKDRRFLVSESEFGSVLKVLKREGNTLSTMLRNAWDSKALRNLSKTNRKIVRGAHISVIGHITVEELNSLITPVELTNGFANRFLWFYVSRKKLISSLDKFDIRKIDIHLKKLKNSLKFSAQIGELRLSNEAQNYWHDLYKVLEVERLGVLNDLTVRASSHILKIAAIFSLSDKSYEISARHLEASHELWKLSEESCKKIFGNSLRNPMSERILSELECQPAGITRSSIRDLFHRKKTQRDIEVALDLLGKHRLAMKLEVPTSGRPREIWYLPENKVTVEKYHLFDQGNCSETSL